jgi:MFS family permease
MTGNHKLNNSDSGAPLESGASSVLVEAPVEHPLNDKPTHDRPAGSGVSLLPVMAVVFIGFLIVGFALPVLPLHAHHGMGFGTFIVGLVTGSQFAASILSRVWAGHYADTRGAKRTVITGLLAATVAGAFYHLSLLGVWMPQASVGILLLGRALLGCAESFIITGAVSWGLALVGPERAGQVIAWMGMAMFAAMALGAPMGTALYQAGGFSAVALATVVLPLMTLVPVSLLSPVPVQTKAKGALWKVAGAVWLPGVGAALSSIGFGAILAFGALLFDARGWSPVWIGFSSYAIALVAARALFGDLPDRLGGAKVALASVVVEVTGLILIWLAPTAAVAAAGAALTGFGYALVYPGLGAEAIRRAPPESRGMAMGAYTVFLDIALGFGSPALGLVAGAAGLGAVFLTSAIVVLGAAVVAALLLVRPTIGMEQP